MSCTKEGYQYDDTGTHRGLRTDAVVPSTLNTKSSYDVIVIGSGFCALVAARNLALDRNLRVLLLEARDRIGGRTWTAKAWGEEFEMGGTFVHWHQPHFYAEMHRHGLEKHIKMSAGTTTTDTILYKPRGLNVMGLDVAEYNPRIASIAEMFFSIDGMTPREVMPYPHEPSRPQPWQRYDLMSCQDRLDQLDISQEDKDQFVCHTNSFGSSAARDIAWTDALRWYALGGYSLQTMYDAVGCFKLGNGGMTNFARHILEEYNGDRIFNKAVTAIKEAKNAKGTPSRVYHPLNCLSDVQFDPPLSPAKQSAAQADHTNLGEKYHFVLNETQENWFANTSDPQSSFLFGMKDHDGTQFANRSGSIAMMFGHSGKLTDPTKSEQVINEFKKLQPSGDVRGYLSHTWSEDLYAKGAWFCAFPGQATKSLKALQEPHGRVFMASADWAQGWRGFIDGAIEQGARASAIVKFALEQEDCISTSKL
ncbi:FAD/NAD(P)-binding domain-containing protein, partial [Aureobasidium melanogenum]